MAVRLHMKLGVVAEHDRLPDSPDTVVVVEPSVGSVARTKGHLYLLATLQVSTRHALEATRLTAETIRNEYYYDESADPSLPPEGDRDRQQWLAHQSDRLGLRSPGGNGPIGVGVAVVRGSEMYVATVGPAEAYLIRQARLLDPARSAPRTRPAVRGARARRGGGRDLVRRLARAGEPERRRAPRPRGAWRRHADAPPAVRDGAPPPPICRRRRQRQRRRDRLRGDRGERHCPPADARPGQARGAARRRARPLADPVGRQRPGSRDGRPRRIGQREDRGRGALERVVVRACGTCSLGAGRHTGG